MTLDGWVTAVLAYLVIGVPVALALWPIRMTDSVADDVVRGLIFVGWPFALVVAAADLVLRSVGAGHLVGRRWSRP